MQYEKVVSHIVNWMGTYANSATSSGFVVGVSGGIDSALTSTLAAKTGLKTLLVEMPIHQDAKQVTRAQNHIALLKQRFSNVVEARVDLSSVYDTFIDTLPSAEETASKSMALVNSRARLRMTTLYYFAGLHGLLVAGTGNKVEDFGVGFYTKYGDGGVDLSPIADLLKTEVQALAKHLGVLSEILIAPPTDGLWGDDRTDEDQIGASYPELEWAMKQQELGKIENDFSGREAEVMNIYFRLNRANQHKMLPIPICEIPSTFKIKN